MANAEKKIATAMKVAKKVNDQKTTKTAKAVDTSVVKKVTSKKEDTTPKVKAQKKAKAEVIERVAPQVALAINKTFCGINLFFDSKEHKTAEDSTFMKSEMKMRWNNNDKCWYVKFRDKDQLDRVIDHFGDRLWLPEDLDKQVSEVLGAMSKTKKKAEPTVSFKTLTQLG